MILTLTGLWLPSGVRSVTINGAYVSATINGQAATVRHPDDDNWYDERHVAVMKALAVLENAVADLLSDKH